MDTKDQIGQSEIDLIDYIKIIYKRRWMVLIIVIVSALFTGISSLCQPKMYEASATFFPLNLNVNYNIQSEGIVMKPRLGIEDLIISILNSRKMADMVIEQLDLKNLWNAKLTADAQNTLKSATKITLEQNGIIRLSVRNKSPELTAKIVNAYVDNLDYFNRQLDIGAQRQIVQVIDRATVPETRMPRGTIKKTMLAGFISFMTAVFLVFSLEFIKKSDIKKRLREKEGC